MEFFPYGIFAVPSFRRAEISPFPLKLQYHKVLGDFFEKNIVKAYDFYMILNSTTRST